MASLPSGSFQINDVVLIVPPEQIHVERRSVNHIWQTLRTRSSIKVKSGYSMIDVSLSVKFTDKQGEIGRTNGHDQLQKLIAEFRFSPFCYVQNNFIRDSILGDDNTQTMALVLKQMEIRKTADTTNVIEVFFNFSWFNYFPYSRNFSFKKDIFDPTEVKSPKDSKAYKKMVDAEFRRIDYPMLHAEQFGDGKGVETRAAFRQFAQLVPGNYNKLVEERQLLKEYRRILAKSGHMYETSSEFAEKMFLLLGDERAAEVKKDVEDVGTSMFKTQDLTEAQRLEVLESVMFNDLQANSYSMPAGVGATEWVPVHVKSGKRAGEVIKYKDNPTAKRPQGPGQGDTSKDAILLERMIRFNFNDQGLIVTGVSVSFENVLAVMPLIGHPYPSHQHIGSIDAVVTLSMMTTKRTGIQALSGFYSTIETQAFKYRMAPQGQRNVLIIDPIVNACGLSEFIPENLVVDTVPGQPGTYSAILTLIDSPISAGRREEIIPAGSFLTTQSIRSKIAEILLKDLKVETGPGQTNEMYEYRSKSPGKDRDARFFSLCDAYINELDRTLSKVRARPTWDHKKEGDIFKRLIYTRHGFSWISPDHYDPLAEYVEPKATDMELRKEFWGNLWWPKTPLLDLNKIMNDWRAFSVKFINKILYSSHIEDPGFAEVRELMAAGMGASGDCYPDFPLREVVADLKDYDKENYKALRDLAVDLQLLQKNLPVHCLIGPDFYFYNNTDALPQIIPPEVVGAARTAVLESQKKMVEAEKTWVEQGYEKKYLGEDRKKQIDEDSQDLEKDKEYWAENDDHPKHKGVVEAMKGMLGGAGVWHPDDLPAGGILNSSLGAAKEDEEPIIAQEISDIIPKTGNESNVIGARRKETPMGPQDHYKEIEHRFGSDAISLASSVLWSWPTSNKDECKKPKDNFGEEYIAGETWKHTGVDISHIDGKVASRKLDVRAAADGQIVEVKPEKFKKVKRTWSREWTVMVEKTIDGKKQMVPEQRKKDIEISTKCEVHIQHPGGWKTVYKHMQWEDDEGKFQKIWNAWFPPEGVPRDMSILNVVKGDPIGKIGTTGESTSEHLHFETILNGTRKNPLSVLRGDLDKDQGPSTTFNTGDGSLLDTCVNQLEKDLVDGQAYSMIRAYPTFRLYFIESDMGERKRFGFDDFFSYSSVKEIQVIRNRKIPADLCLLSITNVSGALSSRKFKDGQVVGPEEDPLKPETMDTIKANRMQQLMLQPGIQIQLRLGYNNNPDELEKVFNGVITDVQFSETDDMVNITCQSFAIQLTQILKGEKKKKFGGWFSNSGRTAAILEELLASPEVTHFGRWNPSLSNPMGADGLATEFSSILSDRWEFTPKPYDDNVFAPTGRGWRGIWDSTPEYTADETTIWDVFQEMTLRHPGFIACAVPYDGKFGPRMTMFFGCPEQLYNARDSTFKEDGMLEGLKRFIKVAQTKAAKHVDPTRQDLQEADATLDQKKVQEKVDSKEEPTDVEIRDFWLNKMAKSYALDKDIVRAFRSYHVLTSTLHILFNNITSTSYECFNTITLRYKAQYTFFSDLREAISGEYDSFTLKCDAAIPDEDVREVFAQYDNCLGYEMAKRYAVGRLFHVMKEGYKGSIVILGNPTIKPYDICYIFDEYTDMFGPIEVEQVVHRFSQETGFITEITPDMLVHVNRLSTLSTADAMGYAAETALKKLGMQSLPSLNEASSKKSKVVGALVDVAGASANVVNTIQSYAFAPIANMFFNSTENASGENSTTNPFALLGVFIFRKLITRSQLAHPFRFSPLVKNGKPMLGGLPSKKIDGSFITSPKQWFKEAEEGVPLLLEDAYDKLHPSTWWNPSWGSVGAWFLGSERHGRSE